MKVDDMQATAIELNSRKRIDAIHRVNENLGS
jgi:hypothetical protein